jgi:hypothetical protein
LKSVIASAAFPLDALTKAVFAEIPRQRENLAAKIRERC